MKNLPERLEFFKLIYSSVEDVMLTGTSIKKINLKNPKGLNLTEKIKKRELN